MRYVWSRKDVLLESVVPIVEEFFTSRNFVQAPSSEQEKRSKKTVALFETSLDGKYRSVSIEVFKCSEGFGVDFDPEHSAKTLTRMGTLSTLFGGGIVIRRRLESSDPRFYERLEGEFIDFLERRLGVRG